MTSQPRDPWERHAGQWAHVGPPLRPSPEDVAVVRSALAEWLTAAGRRDATVLLMGVTPELCALPIPGGRVIAVDKSGDMIRWVWPGRLRTGDAAICADWRWLPLAASSIDVALADGSLSTLPFPAGYVTLGAELRRSISPGGRCVLRFFVQPRRRETTDDVLSDLLRGRIGNFHVLKWRLAMALQEDAEAGVAVDAIWNILHAEWPDPVALAARLGWPIEEVRTIDAYRGVETRYSFPTLTQVETLLADVGLSVVRVHTPSYELGERCPTLVLQRNEGSPQAA